MFKLPHPLSLTCHSFTVPAFILHPSHVILLSPFTVPTCTAIIEGTHFALHSPQSMLSIPSVTHKAKFLSLVTSRVNINTLLIRMDHFLAQICKAGPDSLVGQTFESGPV